MHANPISHRVYIYIYLFIYLYIYLLYLFFYIFIYLYLFIRPEGEGANIDRRLVPYHAKCMRIQSHIEFIYLFIYLYICINRGPRARHQHLGLVKSLQQKLIG